jgi:hypothetical protein
MITKEQLIEALNSDSRRPFQTMNVDHDFVAISLLRNKVPYEACKNIIGAAEHDVLYLCDIDKCIDYLDVADLEILSDCNVCYESDTESLYLFV